MITLKAHPISKYEYDENGNLTRLDKGATHWQYHYDENDNLFEEVLSLEIISDTPRIFTISYGYDTLDHQTRITYPNGLEVNYSPDALGRPTQVSGFADHISYHANGQLARAELSNGQIYEVKLNQRQFPEQLGLMTNTGILNQGFRYQYDGAGNVTLIDGPSYTISGLRYDGLHRLEHADGPWGIAQFRYDALGNLIQRQVGNDDLSLDYIDNRLHTVSGTEARTYSYDRYGNVADDGQYRYRYDEASNLIEVTGSDVDISHSYDGHQHRTLTVDHVQASRRYEIHDQAGALLFELNLDTCQQRAYIRLNGQLLARYDQIDDETDSDQDGLTDCLEDRTGLNPLDHDDADQDIDSDGLSNAEELTLNTDLVHWDTDRDGLSDGEEVSQGTDPTSPLLRTYPTGSSIVASPVLGTDGTLYVASTDGVLYAFDADGNEKWRFETPGVITGTPTVDTDGTLYFGIQPPVANVNSDSIPEHSLFAVDTEGLEKWSLPLGEISGSPAIAEDGTLYVASSQIEVSGTPAQISIQHAVHAINPDSTAQWSYTTDTAVTSSLAIDHHGRLYFGTEDGQVHAIDAHRQLLWSYATGAAIHSSPAIDADGRVYIGSSDGYLYALNSDPEATERLIWRYETGAAVNASPILGHDVLYVGSDSGYVYALDLDPNAVERLVWRFFAHGTVDAAPALGANGTIYFGSGDDHVYAVNSDGQLQWHYRTGADVDTAPVISTQQVLYVGSLDGSVYVFSTSEALADSPWPLYQRDAQRRGGTEETLDTTTDTDGDGIPDSVESHYGLDPSDPNDADQDLDQDGYSNAVEYLAETNLIDDRDFPTAGRALSVYTTEGEIHSSAAIAADGTIYISSTDGYLYALTEELKLKWRYKSDSGALASPAIGADGTIYVGSTHNALFALYPNGEQKWRYDTAAAVNASPSVAHDQTVYFGDVGGQLYAINPNGELNWYYDTVYKIKSAPTIAADGTLYVSSGRYLYKLSSRGELLWRYYTGSTTGSPILAKDGDVYVGD